MYIPKHFEQKDVAQAISFAQQYSFGLLIINGADSPIATHLPFIIEQEDKQYYLYSHMAKANPQWKNMNQAKPLVVFSEPHAYISPQYYTRESVPTWNYVAVHFYGEVEWIESEEAVLELMEKSIRNFDPNYLQQWENRTENYIQKLLRGLVAFRIKITACEAKEKPSQNRNQTEQQNIITGLKQSKDSSARDLEHIMDKKYNDD